MLVQRGFRHHIVEGGGDTYVSGTKGDKPWMVGIQRPDRPGSLAGHPRRATGRSSPRATTSGSSSTRASATPHILDPKTGWPIPEERSARSVTVLARDATDADAYATAVAVMGPEKGLAFVESHPELEAVIIDHTGELLISRDLQPELVWPPSKALCRRRRSRPGAVTTMHMHPSGLLHCNGV